MRFGIAVDSLDISQMSILLIGQMNQVAKLDTYVDVIVFYHTYGRLPKTPLFGMMQEEYMWGYSAPVISTDLRSTSRLLTCPKPTKKFFYVWDLEWILGGYDIEQIIDIYCHPDIKLIARSQEHANAIANCWKDPVAILEDFNHEQLISIITR